MAKRSTEKRRRQRMPTLGDDELDVQSYCRYVAPRQDFRQIPLWPPDAFAIVAALLQKSGAYVHVVDRWPPTGRRWIDRVKSVALRWRRAAAARDRKRLPPELDKWWSEFV
ncbi:MAG TPA: hypothetical protein VGJ82_23105, partial [Thermoanaerobaculia bacterium]